MFEEIGIELFPEFAKEDYAEYFLTGKDPEIFRLFNYKNYYIVAELVNDNCWLSIIKDGEKSHNILSQCKNLIDELLKEHRIAFFWRKGIRNEVLIQRLLANYSYTNYNPNDNCSFSVIDNEKLF